MNSVRYKVKVKSPAALDQMVALIEHEGFHVESISRRFHFFAVDNPSDEIVKTLKRLGAKVTPDPVYELD